jgi:Ca2+-binding RTX toxin-like protein
MDGGSGADTVSYAGSTLALNVSLALATQNTSGAGTDTLTSFENLTGGSGDDTLTGDGGANSLTGGKGNDDISGGRGKDACNGGPGSDSISGCEK